MVTVFEALSLKGLRLSHLVQLSAYIEDREQNGWYYGNKEGFEKRHEDLKRWIESAITFAKQEGVKFPKGGIEMIYTNKHGFPEEVFNVLSKERYDSGEIPSDYSVTTLKTPPRIVQLQRRHKEDITEDVVDQLWSMFGHMAHSMLEEHGSDNSVIEKRLYLNIFDRLISGQIDHYKEGTITDYKVTSAWTLVYGSRVKEWEEQLNMYAYLCEQNGLPVKHIRIVTILRDWDKHKARQNQDYPQTPLKIIPITLWSKEEQKEFTEHCVHKQINAEWDEDEFLPHCTPEEMWEQPSKFAVMKEGRKSAVRVFDTKEEALTFISTTYPTLKEAEHIDLVVRPGKRTRCEEYCSVNCFCSQFKEYMKTPAEGGE